MIRALPVAFALAMLAGDAARIHREAIVVDTHNDITMAMTDDGFDLGRRDDSGLSETDIPRMKEGGLDAEFFAIYVAPDYARKGGAARRALEMIDAVHEATRRNPELEMAYTAADVRRIAKAGKIAALMGLEGGHAIEDSLAVLRNFYRLGIRYMTLTHSNNNNWADSSGDVKRHGGLTNFGRKVILEMNRLGMMVDVSHVSDATFYDVLKTTRAPVIASHSSARALVNVPRNMSDDMLRAMAKNGGVVMVNFGGWFLDPSAEAEWNAKLKAEDALLRKQYAGDRVRLEREQRKLVARLPRVPLATLIDHFAHIAKVAGTDHVGIGSDFDGVSGYLPQGMEDVSKLPAITSGLLNRGFSEADLKKVLGENILRVMAEVEKRAAAAR